MTQSVMKKLITKLRSSTNNTKKSTTGLDYKVENPIWLKNELTRDEARAYLMDKEIGVFIVRQSETVKDCYVLSVKVPKYMNQNEISHYIIHKTKHAYSIRGFNKEFSDLKSLVTHCSFIRDMIPVLLDLNYYRQEIIANEKEMNDLYYFTSVKASLPSTNSVGSLNSEDSLD